MGHAILNFAPFCRGCHLTASYCTMHRYRPSCWTCRLRRKKCDGQPKQCTECLRLGLVCDGYGAKPSWKDNGEEEQEYRMKIKQRVRNFGKSRPAKGHRSQSSPLLMLNSIYSQSDREHFSNIDVSTALRNIEAISSFDCQSLSPTASLTSSHN